jgi:formamidopyrimidine-DNA glycosylase
MIELPEAVTIARELNAAVRGKRIVSSNTGSSPHKWVFYKPDREKLERRLRGQTIGDVTSTGRAVHLKISSDRILTVDDFGGRVTYHRAGERRPKKYHLLLGFRDESYLTVAIQGWGFIALDTKRQLDVRSKPLATALAPVGRASTLKRFKSRFGESGEKDPIKTFFTNRKNVAGIGNGYLQDILFRARIDPRRKVADITNEEKAALHRAVRETVSQAIGLNGRECERDIYGQPGRYKPVMDRHAAGKPCPACRATIQKMSYLGGSCYVCPKCQT